MFNKSNFCHIASNNRNEQKGSVFIYKTTDTLAQVTQSGYFNEKLIDINLHDFIIHEQTDNADKTKVKYNILAVTERTLDNVGTTVIKKDWETDIETAIANLRQYVDNTFVRLDGTSIMTGDLRFQYNSTYPVLRIIQSEQNTNHFRFINNNSASQSLSMDLSQAAIHPLVTGRGHVGTTNIHFGDAHIDKIYTGFINNGYDIAVPVTNGADTLALKSEVDLAANSGRMLTDQGVWYAKMYAATVAPAAEDGTNYADFSQTDGQGNPVIVTYNRVNGAWVQDQTITPPAEYDGYVPITSKIWDIAEQTNQQGGRILWNHQTKTFTPYPFIISTDNMNITNSSFQGDATLSGESTVAMPATPTPQQIVNKDYVDSVADPLKYATNCITEIPQDIKLELNNGTLTLKAGSKVYVPNGAGNFDELVIQNDLTATAGGDSPTLCLVKADGTGIVLENKTSCASGSTDPLSGTAYHTWYDTTNNRIKRYGANGSYAYDCALPVASVARSSTEITSIRQIFNGFGYIGSTVFALPGVKGLIPNGRNTDGSLNNIEFTISAIQTMAMEDFMVNRTSAPLAIKQPGELTGMDIDPKYWGTVKKLSDIVRPSYYACYYCLEDNLVHYFDASGVEFIFQRAFVGSFDVDSNNKVTQITSKTAFHAVDYSDTEFVAHQAMPSSKYVDWTLGASGTQYTAPADGYISCVLSTTINGYLSMYSTYWQNGSVDGAYVGGMVPIRAGASINVFYEGLLQVVEFRFRYAVGAK